MAYAYYKKMSDALVYQAMKKLPEWMVEVSERFDEVVNRKKWQVPGPCHTQINTDLFAFVLDYLYLCPQNY